MTGSTGRWMAAAAYLILGVAAPAGAGEPEWRRFQDQATGHFQRGNFEQAELFARQALKEAESSLGPEHRATEQSLASLYAALRHQNKLDEAVQAIGAALQVKGNYLDAVFLLSQIEAARGKVADRAHRR